MALGMQAQSRCRVHSRSGPRPSRLTSVRVAAQFRDKEPIHWKPALVAGMVALTSGLAPMTITAPVMAYEVSESSLLPLEKQQAQQERRRDLLHAARDQTKALDAELAARNAVEAEASAATAADEVQDSETAEQTHKEQVALQAQQDDSDSDDESVDGSPHHFDLSQLMGKLSFKLPSLDSLNPFKGWFAQHEPRPLAPTEVVSEVESEMPVLATMMLVPAPSPAAEITSEAGEALVSEAADEQDEQINQSEAGEEANPMSVSLTEFLLVGSVAALAFVAINYQKEATSAISQALGVVTGFYKKAEDAVKKVGK